MKAKEFIPASKPRNFVAKNQKTAGAGAHKDKKRAEKQGDVKHKNKQYDEGVSGLSDAEYNTVARYAKSKYPAMVIAALGRNPDGSVNVRMHDTKGLGITKEFKVRFRDPEETDIKEAGVSDKTVKQLQGLFKQAKAGKLKSDGRDFTKGDHWQGVGPDDYGYTGYQGHGMPVDKKKPVKEARRLKGADLQLKLVDRQEDDDTDLDDVVTDYYFDVYQNGQKVGHAQGDSYYGELVVKVDFYREFKLDTYHDKDHPLIQQFEKFQQQGVAEGMAEYDRRRRLQRQINKIESIDFYITDDDGLIVAGPFEGRSDATEAFERLVRQRQDINIIQGRALIVKLAGLREGDDLGHLDAEVFGLIDAEKKRRADLKKNDPAAYAKELEKDRKNYGRGIMGALRRKYNMPLDEFAPGGGDDNSDDLTDEAYKDGQRLGMSLVDGATRSQGFKASRYLDRYLVPFSYGWNAGRKAKIAQARRDGVELAMKKDGSLARVQQGVAEGWSDAMVARRTGRPRTPYSVYIKGKKWKDFANDDHARTVMDKLKAKFRADGRDPETITIAPTDMSEGQTALEKFRKAAAEREKKHSDAEKEMKARHASGKENMKGAIDRLEKHLNNK